MLLPILLIAVACSEEILGGTLEPQGRPLPQLPLPPVRVEHEPDRPTLHDVVTISADASRAGAIASTTIRIGGNVVKHCDGAQCEYGSPFSAGTHSYDAVATDSLGRTFTSATRSFTVTAGPALGGGSSSSPHWRHMRTSTIDYRIHYQPPAQRGAEYAWAASRFDHVTGGDLAEYKSRNPTIRHFPYDTYWFTPQSSAAAMDDWLAANGYPVEEAYLHVAGGTKTSGDRVTAQQFAGRDYWYYDVGDPGFQAWREHRTRQLTATRGGLRSDGIFFDTNSRNTVRKYVPPVTLEYATYADYFEDFDALLEDHRSWVPAGFVMLNQSTYFDNTEEIDLAAAAGGTMTEFVNGPYRNPQWDAVDAVVRAGGVVEYGTAIKANHKGNSRYGVTRGNYTSIAERVLLWEYASYLMVVDPQRMDAVYFEPYLGSWDTPMSSVWLPAYEYDIGLATGPRTVRASGTDPAGQDYQVFERPFENALVLIRPQGGRTSRRTFDYGEASAVTVDLPPGTWRMLLGSGVPGGEVASVQLRAGEAAILVR